MKITKRGKPDDFKSKESLKLVLMPVRYIILLCLIFTLPIIYKVFTILTLYPDFFLLKLVFKNVVLVLNQQTLSQVILIQNITPIELIPACIAGSAYLFLLFLNLTVPMNPRTRIFSIILSILILLVLNILRIFVLSTMYHLGSPLFYFTHILFWYFLSTIFVIGIWFLIVKIFSIKEIPVYTDVNRIIEHIKRGK